MNVDWPGLLKWSLQYSDGTHESDRQARSKEDFEFLEQAIKDFFANEVDPNKLVKDAVPKLSNPQEALAGLAVLQECLDLNAEIARNLDKLGALEPLVKHCLSSENAMTLETTLAVLSFALPNNPPIQKRFFELGGVDLLLEEFVTRYPRTNGSADETRLFSRLLTCMSAAIKNEDDVVKAFATKEGHVKLADLLLNCQDSKILAKAMSLLRYMLDVKLMSPLQKAKVAKGLANAMQVIEKEAHDWQSSERISETAFLLTDRWLTLHKKESEKWSAKSTEGRELRAAAEARQKVLKSLKQSEDCAVDELRFVESLLKIL